MHLTMNHCEGGLDPDLIHQLSGDSGTSAGEHEESPSAAASRGSGGCLPRERPVKVIPCPRCQSMNTKFCYYNNYSVNQPRHFCRNCQRYWTVGGTLRNVPVGGGSRKKVRTSRGQRFNDGLQSHHQDTGRGSTCLQTTGSALLNMTLQPNELFPSAIQMAAATQQQLSMLSQAAAMGAVGRLGSYSANQLLHSAAGLIESPSINTISTTQLPTNIFFQQFPNMQQQQERGQMNAYSTTGTGLTSKTCAPASLMNYQDHQLGASTPAAHSVMYDLQSTHPAPNSTLQMQLGASHDLQTTGFNNHPNLEANQIEFLSSLMQHKPGYWGA